LVYSCLSSGQIIMINIVIISIIALFSNASYKIGSQ